LFYIPFSAIIYRFDHLIFIKMNTGPQANGGGEEEGLEFDFNLEFPGDDQFGFEMEDEDMEILFDFEG
jgi:hypothetical protein